MVLLRRERLQRIRSKPYVSYYENYENLSLNSFQIFFSVFTFLW